MQMETGESCAMYTLQAIGYALIPANHKFLR